MSAKTENEALLFLIQECAVMILFLYDQSHWFKIALIGIKKCIPMDQMSAASNCVLLTQYQKAAPGQKHQGQQFVWPKFLS